MPPDLSAINIACLKPGTMVKLGVSVGRLRRKLISEGVFRILPGSDQRRHNLDKRDLKRIVNFNRRKFLGQVIDNHAQAGELLVEIREPRSPLLYYQILFPYRDLFSLSRLVFQALPDLTLEQEDLRRRNNRQSFVDKVYIHPLDKFVPVRITGPMFQSEQERSFKWTVPTTGDTFTITIPGGGMCDVTYTVAPSYSYIPPGGVIAGMYFPSAGRTKTTLDLCTSAPLLAGTVLDINLRDS